MPIFPIPTSENLPKPLHFATALNALIFFLHRLLLITRQSVKLKFYVLM